MGFDGPHTDLQPLADVTVHESVPDELQHLLLAGGDASQLPGHGGFTIF